MKNLDLLQEYIGNLALWNVKLHNLHWNVVGPNFMEIHEFTEEIYDNVFEQFDQVAELLKMKNQIPLATMAEYLEITTLKEISTKEYDTRETLEIVKKDLELMKDLATKIRNSANEEDDFETVAIFEDYVADYSKNLWFVNVMLK